MRSTSERVAARRATPPDQAVREQALDAARSVLVQAPAGSGKTDLLTRRFLRLLGEVDEPGQLVAITFTRPAAAEMRHRILAELEKAAARSGAPDDGEHDEFSMELLAARALARSQALGWNLIELPAQLRILTIDAFCRELALQQPLLSGLGGGLDIFENPHELYRRAARHTLEQIDTADAELRAAIESLLLWRDNGWQEMEDLLVKMLEQRDRWMQGFVLDREPDWDALRNRLERPFTRAAREQVAELSALLDQVPRARSEVLELARFACAQAENGLRIELQHLAELAKLAEFPAAPFDDAEMLEDARQACACLAKMLLTQNGGLRKRIDVSMGFPAHAKPEKARLAALIADLGNVPGLEEALAAVGDLPPACYSEDDWKIVRACFALLRRAAAELLVVFAEAGAVDYTQVAQIALNVLKRDEAGPGDAAIAVADRIRHLLVDEFQDTSRRQHELLKRLIGAWPDREGRTCFVVGDPMQSIYFFRDADAELFPRVRDNGLEMVDDEPLLLDSVALTANFRTVPRLVGEVNDVFAKVFAADDGSGVRFTAAVAARAEEPGDGPQLVADRAPRLNLYLEFMPQSLGWGAGAATDKGRIAAERDAAGAAQVEQIVNLIRERQTEMQAARALGKKYRIAVLGRARTALAPIAAALREAEIPFAAVDLEKLAERPEVLDALALARALLNPHDRVAWLGVLRAPWCGLSLADLHTLASADDAALLARPIPDVLFDREGLLTGQGRAAVRRMRQAVDAAAALRAAQPAAAFGTWIEQVWLRLGGAACVDAAALANLRLFWKCLDGLPAGEADVFGVTLDAALDKLTALADPDADSECGVQLMTIHKAKGLEFEVVIVPELQAKGGSTRGELLSWMERGLADADETGEATEFLVAPIPAKGAERGGTKMWVDCARRERETQEMRRLLYVAGTRAREELHLFARPAYKAAANESFELLQPKDCLLATAWPALGDEVCREFEKWSAGEAVAAQSSTVEAIAASGENHVIAMPEALKPTVLRRLPLDFEGVQGGAVREIASPIVFGGNDPQPYRRHEGGLLSRALGIAVHALLEELARLRTTQDWDAARAALAQFDPRIAAQVRAAGIEPKEAAHIAARALGIALDASHDPVGQWILSPRAEAASEARWAGVVSGSVHAVRVDRVFRAGPQLRSEGEEAWWLVDYKTAHADGLNPDEALPELRETFAPQLEAYARVLRNLRGADARIFAGLYYPRMMKFDWWEM